MWISELHEGELINMADKGEKEELVRGEWFKRWGLKFPYIRTAHGIIKYGETKESFKLLNEKKQKLFFFHSGFSVR